MAFLIAPPNEVVSTLTDNGSAFADIFSTGVGYPEMTFLSSPQEGGAPLPPAPTVTSYMFQS
jgi:hypothetical protein